MTFNSFPTYLAGFSIFINIESLIILFKTVLQKTSIFKKEIPKINNYFHLVIGWNFLAFDWQYIFNRCNRIGIDVKKASPTKKLTTKNIEINETTKIELKSNFKL